MPDKFVKRIGVFGGTFDPVHLGHLGIADQLQGILQLDELHLMLAAQPPLREAPGTTAEQRWEMLQLALQQYPNLTADDREMRREGISYSYDSVAELREEVGADTAIALCLGWDSLVSLPNWHRWAELLELCALVVVNRPHHKDHQVPLPSFLQERVKLVRGYPELKAGEILEIELPPSPISATQIRESIALGKEISGDWLTEEVANYIKQNQLYGMQ